MLEEGGVQLARQIGERVLERLHGRRGGVEQFLQVESAPRSLDTLGVLSRAADDLEHRRVLALRQTLARGAASLRPRARVARRRRSLGGGGLFSSHRRRRQLPLFRLHLRDHLLKTRRNPVREIEDRLEEPLQLLLVLGRCVGAEARAVGSVNFTRAHAALQRVEEAQAEHRVHVLRQQRRHRVLPHRQQLVKKRFTLVTRCRHTH
mmetsp:Transcript_13095/g.28293  ORF Transcript_13095/g.28293 Transcript_13095/m.28293 type:complete len:206 (-) Transcript_13095:346-963(-)